MSKNRPLVFAKPVEVETAVEEVLLALVETLDEEVVLADEEVVLTTELVGLDVDFAVVVAAAENVRNGVSIF